MGICGVDSSADDEVALELDVGVADDEIDAHDAVRSGRRLGADVAFICDDVGTDDEVAEGGADVVLGSSVGVAFDQPLAVLDRCTVVFVEQGLLCGAEIHLCGSLRIALRD